VDDRKRFFLFAALLAAIALIELRCLLFLGQTFFRADVSYNIEPSVNFARTFLLQHHKLAMWNPWILCGVSQVAASWPLWYPPTYIGLSLPFGCGAGCYLFFHLMTAGIGGYLWSKFSFENEDGDSGTAMFFALALMLNGYMFGATINLSLMAAASWIPLALFFVDSIIRAPKWWKCGALSLVLGIQFAAGRPEIALGAYLLYGLRLLVLLKKSPAGGKSATLVILSMVLSGVLNAANIWPLFELLINNPSATENSVFKATYWSAGWRDWLSMLIPLPFGKLSMNSNPNDVTYAGAMPYLVSLFLGPVILTLCAFELSATAKRNWFWIGFALLMLSLCLGEFGPFGFIFLQQNLVRYPIKFGIFVIISILVLASGGWARLGKAQISKRATTAVASAWFAILMAAVMFNFPGNSSGKWQLIGAATLGMLACWLARGQQSWRPWILGACAILPLCVNCELQLSDLAPEKVFLSTSSVAHFIKSNSQMDRKQYRVLPLFDNSTLPPPTVGYESEPLDQSFTKYCREILRPNCNADFEVQSTNGMSVIPTWTSLFLDTGILPRSTLTSIKHPLGKSNIPLFRFCQATSTAFVITTAQTEDDSGNWSPSPALEAPLFKLIKTDRENNVRIYKVSSFRARASIVPEVKMVADRTEALKYINRSDSNGYDPMREVILIAGAQSSPGAQSNPGAQASRLLRANDSAAQPNPGAQASRLLRPKDSPATANPGAQPSAPDSQTPSSSQTEKDNATIVLDDNDEMRIDATCSKRATLVITDGFYPGWQAFDNGQPIEVLLADGVLRAIPLQPGKHHIELNFRPKSMMLGAIISLFAIALAAALLLSGLRRKPS